MSAWTAVAQVAGSILGDLFGRKSQKKAERKSYDAFIEAQRAGTKTEKKVTNRLKGELRDIKNASDKKLSDTAGKAIQAADKDRQRMVNDAKRTERVAGRSARIERRVAREDEATRFTRLRASADAAGFNPLTLIQAGYLGTSLPSGVLSADFYSGMHATRAGFLASDAATKAGVYSNQAAVQSSSDSAYADQVVGATAQGWAARSQVFSEVMSGHETAIQAGASAYDRKAGLVTSIGDAIGDGIGRVQETRRADRQWREQMDLERERFRFDQDQFRYEREFNERRLAELGRSSPGFGAPMIGTASRPTITNAFGRDMSRDIPYGEDGSLDIKTPQGLVIPFDERNNTAAEGTDVFGEGYDLIAGTDMVITGADAATGPGSWIDSVLQDTMYGRGSSILEEAWNGIRKVWNDTTTVSSYDDPIPDVQLPPNWNP